MKRVLPLLVLVAVARSGTINLSPTEKSALSAIDIVPTPAQIDAAFGGSATNSQTKLIEIAQAADSTQDIIAVRLRAIHALGKYCLTLSPPPKCSSSDPAHVALHDLVAGTAGAKVGSDVLVLRAAVEAIGPLEVQTDLDILLPLLDHPSRDIRASTAHALRDLCNTGAINPLRVRYQHESTDQVKLAISEALRVLPCVQ